MLSGGQKQRVSIARIFPENPPVLILDEATSALDSVTESRIQSALDALAEGRTTLIIAHCVSTIRSAGRIIAVADGKIVEEGTHDELEGAKRPLRQAYRTQNLGEMPGSEIDWLPRCRERPPVDRLFSASCALISLAGFDRMSGRTMEKRLRRL